MDIRFNAARARARKTRSTGPRPVTVAVVIAIAVTSLALPPQLLSQQAPPVFQGRIDLVTVTATVADRKKKPIADLSADDFAIYEDGKPQEIRAFAVGSGTAPPLHVGVLLDTSGSQEVDLGFTQSAVIKFLRSLNDAEDITFIDFATQVSGTRYARSDIAYLTQRIRGLKAQGQTSLYDAIGIYLDGSSDQGGRNVMVLYTDGADTSSSLDLGSLARMLKASDATLYTIGALDNQPIVTRDRQRQILMQIAETTGGSAFFPSSTRELDRIYSQILGEVQAQYTLGYVSTNDNSDGRWRKVEIKIARADAKDFRVRARKGYYAPIKP